MPRPIALPAAAALLIVSSASGAHALGPCAKLVGKQITLRGNVTYVEQLQIGATQFDVIIARSTEPSCGTFQTTGKWRSCRAGMKFAGTGRLTAGPASRSAGSKKPGATDYGFEPISEDGLCR